MNTLNNEKVSTVLNSLHEKSAADSIKRAEQRRKKDFSDWNTAYLAIDRDQGNFLYFLATLQKAKSFVEFGCSYGISTIYLASAARDNGGHVTTTDIEPNKIAGTKDNLENAGLSTEVSVLEGDAMETLATIKDTVDFLFLDGAKILYLPVFELLYPKLSKGAVIVADNIDKPETWPLVDRLKNAPDEFTTAELFSGRMLVAYLKASAADATTRPMET